MDYFHQTIVMFEYGFCQMNDYQDFRQISQLGIKIFAKMDILFLLLGIRQGPLSESDCSSFIEIFICDPLQYKMDNFILIISIHRNEKG